MWVIQLTGWSGNRYAVISYKFRIEGVPATNTPMRTNILTENPNEQIIMPYSSDDIPF